MSQELIYTSAPKGLRLGSRGFCTVASTQGMAKNLAERLEALSSYRHIHAPGSAEAKRNPINFSCLKFKLAGKTYHVLSRIGDAGLDYTQRTNKLAHHVVVDSSELSPAGPAWLASQDGILEKEWVDEPRILQSGRTIPQGDLKAWKCRMWQAIAGDAGWAGVLAESLAKQGTSREAYIIFQPGTNVLPLILEAQALLPPQARWDATFSTYFSKVPPSVDCLWRCVADGTPEATNARRSRGPLVIDLVAGPGTASGGDLVEIARTGKPPERAAKLATSQTLPSLELPNQQDTASSEAPITVRPTEGHNQENTSSPPPLAATARINVGLVPIRRQSAVWKSIAIAALLIAAIVTGLLVYSVFFTSRLPAPPSIKDTSDQASTESIDEPPDVNSDQIDLARQEMDEPNEVEEADTGESAPPNKSAAPAVANEIPNETASQAPPEESVEPKVEVPDNVFDNIVQSIDVGGPSQSSLAGGQSKVLLGTFPMENPAISLALVGRSESPDLKLLAQASSKPKTWSFHDGSRDVAKVEISSAEENSSKFEFYWIDKAKPSTGIKNAIVSSVLKLRVPERSDIDPLYISLRDPDRESDPLSIGKAIIKGGRGKVVQEIVVPKGETAKLYFRLEGLDGADVSDTEVQFLTDGQMRSFLFGPRKSIDLKIQLDIKADRNSQNRRKLIVSVELALAVVDQKKRTVNFPKFVRPNIKRRDEKLKLVIENYIDQLIVDVNDSIDEGYGLKEELEELKSQGGKRNVRRISIRSRIRSIEAKIKSIEKDSSWKQLRNGGILSGGRGLDKKFYKYDVVDKKWNHELKNRSWSELVSWERDLRQLILDSNLDEDIDEHLKQHRTQYPHLREWQELLEGLPEKLKLHVRVVRQLQDIGYITSDPVEIDVFVAGEPGT